MEIVRILKKFARFLFYSFKNKRNIIAFYGINKRDGINPWLQIFIENNVKDYALYAPIRVFCQYCDIRYIKWSHAKNKIVVITENNHVPYSLWWNYKQIQDKKGVSLVLGFDYIQHHRYIRFPYWLFTNFSPNADYTEISEYVNNYNYLKTSKTRNKFCSFICRKDYFGDRAYFADLLEENIGALNYPSDFRHNDDDLKDKYDDDKIKYLSQFKFNLCPENSNDKGYVTEKIFEAIKAGCVPIYWGNEGIPEPGILNPEAIIFLKKDGDNSEALDLIKKLNESEESYNEFISQPRFLPTAKEEINYFFSKLKDKIKHTMYP